MRSLGLPLFALLTLSVGPAMAFDADKHAEVETHGAWTLLCDFEEDMGHTTYFGCAVRSEAPVAVLFDGVGTDTPTAYVSADFAATAIAAPGVDLDLGPCEAAGWCLIPGDLGGTLLAAAMAGDPVLFTGGPGLRRVPADGLTEAVAAAEALLD